MALMYSTLNQLGSPLPEFKLESIQGDTLTSADFNKYDILWVSFICNHCPYVQALENRVAELAQKANSQGVGVVAICSNDPQKSPEDSPEYLKRQAERAGFQFPYLVDSTSLIAKKFDAICTPDFFIYQSQKLVYRGQLDDNWKDPSQVQEKSLELALEALLNNENLDPTQQKPSMGCSIKWK